MVKLINWPKYNEGCFGATTNYGDRYDRQQ